MMIPFPSALPPFTVTSAAVTSLMPSSFGFHSSSFFLLLRPPAGSWSESPSQSGTTGARGFSVSYCPISVAEPSTTSIVPPPIGS